MWAAYLCTTCGSLISARGEAGQRVTNPRVEAIFPPTWEAEEILPERAAHYLTQAKRTLNNADASVLMSAASIDAMLKDNGLRDGSLHARINGAVAAGILTQKMADWAHRVRLDSNNCRHADEDIPHISDEDAKRAFEFAEALAQFLYVLPNRMPPEQM